MDLATASTLHMRNSNETFATILHDLAGSLTVLSLNLPQLVVATKGSATHEDVLESCLEATAEARKTLKSAWKKLEESA